MSATEKIKTLLMQKGFGEVSATIIAGYLVANGVVISNERNICEDSMMCCDDDCRNCAQRIYKAYCREHEKVMAITSILNK